jgi:hypothetical protein
MIGGGGMADAGELNIQLTLEAGLALVNDGDQELGGSCRSLGSCDASPRLELGTLWVVSSNMENLRSDPENARP